MEIKPSTQRALSLLAAGLMVIIAIAVFATLVVPEYQKIQILKGELTGKSELYQEQKGVVEQVEKLIYQYEGVGGLKETLALALPTREEVADIVNQLNTITGANGMFIRSVGLDYLPIKEPKKPTLVKTSGSLRLSLNLLGSYAALKNVLGALETNIRVMDIATLKAEPAGDPKKDQDLFLYTLTIDTYYQPD